MIVLSAVLAMVDWRLHANPWIALGMVALAVGGVLAAPLLGRLGSRIGLTRRPWLRLALTVVPLVLALVLRWRGAATIPATVLTAAVPTGLAIGLTWLGKRGSRALGPVMRVRDRIAPRWLRSLLAGTLPIVLTFWLVHGSLRDIVALVGFRATQQTPLAGATWRIALAGAVAAILMFALLHQPAAPSRAGRRTGRVAAAALLLPLMLPWVAALGLLAWQAGPAAAADDGYGDEVCPEGFHWVRMSANGCVQNLDTLPANGGGLSYTQDPLCRDPAYPHKIVEVREAPGGQPIPGSGGKTSLPFLLACLDDAQYEAYLAQNTAPTQAPATRAPNTPTPPAPSPTPGNPSISANLAWVVGGGAVAASALLAAAAAAGWAPVDEPSSFDTDRCRRLTARRKALLARFAELTTLAGQRQGVVALIARTQAGPLSAPTAGPDGTFARHASATSYTAAAQSSLIAGLERTPGFAALPVAESTAAAASAAAQRALSGLGAAATTVSNLSTANRAGTALRDADARETAYLARLEAQRYAAAVGRLKQYRSWLEARLNPKVAALRADVTAYNAEVAAMSTLEGWSCPATQLPVGPLDDLLADAPPRGVRGTPADESAPTSLGHARPTVEWSPPGGCSTYRADLARFDAHSAAVRATMERLNAESRVWLQRSADASTAARPVFAELAEVGHAYGIDVRGYAASTALSVASGVTPVLLTLVPEVAVTAALLSVAASLTADLAFTPSPADAARLGHLTARARFLDSRARYARAECEQRIQDRNEIMKDLGAEYDALLAQHALCSERTQPSDPVFPHPEPTKPDFSHPIFHTTPTVRSIEELASW